MMTPAQLANARRDVLIIGWRDAKDAATKAVAAELAARNALMELFPEPKEGVNTLELGNGYALKLTHKMNYTLSNSDKPKDGNTPLATDAALDAIEKLGNEGSFIAKRLVKWKPELSVTEYRLLLDDSPIKKAIDKALKIAPATPSFELVAPKGV